MKRSFLLFCLLLAVVILPSCKKEKVIPRGEMAEIYAEMFVADQRIAMATRKVRNMADTSLVYEPILEKYGYTSDDYRKSMAFYIQDATRYARILKKSASIIESEIRGLKKEKALLDMLQDAEGMSSKFAPERIFYMTGLDNPDTFGEDSLRFYVDSTGGVLWFDVRQWQDTAYYGPVMVVAADYKKDTDEEIDENGIENAEDGEISADSDSLKLGEKLSPEVIKAASERAKSAAEDVRDSFENAKVASDAKKKETAPATTRIVPPGQENSTVKDNKDTTRIHPPRRRPPRRNLPDTLNAQ